MKLKLLALITAATILFPAASQAKGWGQEQTKGTLRGAFWGSIIGGVTGHQSGKRDEGLLIGGLVGGLIGNKSGQGKDSRGYESHSDPRYNRYEQSRRSLHSQSPYGRTESNSQAPQVDPAIVEARHRAELAERQLQREMERRQAAAQRAKELDALHAREQEARKRLNELNK
jgi:hypothetical protein